MSTTISTETVAAARNLWAQGRVSEAWRLLAAAGDRYADNAAAITGDARDSADRFFQDMVRNHWENTVGSDVYQQKFDEAAWRHLDNYLTHLEDTGALPTTQDIINSYEEVAPLV